MRIRFRPRACSVSRTLADFRTSSIALVRAAAVAAVLVTPTAPAAAQESFADVSRLLRRGDAVTIVDSAGTEVHGRFAGAGPSSLRAIVNGAEREWSAPAIWQIRRHGDSIRNGAIVGAAIGGAIAAAGGLALASLLHNEGHDALGPFLFLAGVGTGGGAALGAGFDALVRDRTLIYQQTNRASIVPSAARRGVGLQVSIRF